MLSRLALRAASPLLQLSRALATQANGSPAWMTQHSLANIDSSRLVKMHTTTPKPKQPKEKLKFGQFTTDHMLEIDWKESEGWTVPRIVPYSSFSVDPAASVFHYGLECFEGLKAYVDDANHVRLFRPMLNMERMRKSALRIMLPDFDTREFLECIKELVRTDRSWIPHGDGYSLYIRPTMISTYPFVGVGPSKQVKLYCILCPVGPYYPSGFKPIRLLAETRYCRAWPGGTGDSKLGANYAGGVLPQVEAGKKGFSQVLWVFGADRQVTEVGTMNQFFFWTLPDGTRELVTAPLDGTILPGVTRDSVLQLTRQWGEFQVSERPYTIDDVVRAVEEDRMIEAFGSGTAAIVSPVNGFQYLGKDFAIPLDKNDPHAKAGPLTQKLADTIMGIQYGRIPHPSWSMTIS